MLRRILLTCAAGAVAAAPLTAQSGFGLVGGLVSSNVSFSTTLASGVTKSSRTGGAVGIFISQRLADKFTIAPEALYIMKGYKTSISGLGDGTVKSSYIEVPVLFRYTLAGSGDTHFFVTAGPEVSFKLTCKNQFGGLPSSDCNLANDPTSGIKSTDFGVMFGAGVSYSRFSGSVRYDAGLTNISRDNTSGATTIKNRAILALVGISFGK